MRLRPGDRVRWAADASDGMPWARYGFISSVEPPDHAIVMFDGDLKSSTRVRLDDLAPVSIGSVELRLSGCDLLEDPALHAGLVALWSAEADEAGLEISNVSQKVTVGGLDGPLQLAEVRAAGHRYVLNAFSEPDEDAIRIQAFPR